MTRTKGTFLADNLSAFGEYPGKKWTDGWVGVWWYADFTYYYYTMLPALGKHVFITNFYSVYLPLILQVM